VVNLYLVPPKVPAAVAVIFAVYPSQKLPHFIHIVANVMVTVVVAVPVLLVAVTVIIKVPVTVGVPEIIPVLGFKLKPAGNVLAV